MVGKTIGKYRVDALLGEGGMGIVYKALDTERDRVVALKILNRDAALDPDVKKRFLREAGAGAGLVHPNIVQVFDTGTHEGQYYLCLEFVEGKNLRDILADGALPPRKVVEIGMAVADALGFAHGMGVIHRDIKAENIMLTSSGGVKIMDFGLAKLQGASMLTREGDIVGTVAYMSPEQAQGELVDPRTDIFSLGVVLYELLTGKLPFWAAYETAIVYSILNTEPVAIRELKPDVPEALEKIVFKALRKEPSKRYQKMDELTGDLARVKAYFDGERDVLPDAMELTAGAEVAREEIWGSQIRLAAKAGFAATLAGREKEFGVLKERLQRATDGSTQLVLLGGEAGIGKTRLAEELESFAKTLRVRTLRGACPGGWEGAYPYQPFVEAIREYLQNKAITDAATLNAYIKELAPDLLAQLPAIRVFVNLREPEDAEPGSREELWDVVASLLRSFSLERPLMLFVDDLQNVDEDSYLFLTQILHRCASARLLVIGSYRSEEVRAAVDAAAHPVERLKKEFESDEKFLTLELGRLSLEAVQSMARSLFADSDFGSGFYESLHQETEGNPFFVVETLKLLKVEGIIEKKDGQFVLREAYDHLVMPKSIHDIVMRRIDRLKEDEREILEIGAVEGESFRSGTVGHCLELGRIRLLKKLQSLERDHHIIHPEENAYRFDHGKIREFLYEAINPELRTEYHRMIGAYLIEEFSSDQQMAGQIAFHLMTGGQDEQAVPYLTSAGDRARRLFANRQAITQYERTLAIIRKLEVSRPGLFAREKEYATEGLADIWSLTGDHEAALASYAELASLPTLAPLRRSELLRKTGAVYMSMGNNEKALELLQGSEKELDSVAQGEQDPEIKKALGKTRITRSRVLKTLGRYDDAKSEVEGGLALLAHDGSDHDLSEAYNNLGVIYEDLGAFELSESMYTKSMEVLQKVGDKKGIADAYNNLANLASSRGDFRKTAEYLKKSLDLMTEIGYRAGIAGACNNLGSMYQDQGRYDESRKMHERCLALREEIGDAPGVAMSHGNLGSVMLDLGEYEEAKKHLQTSLSLFANIGARVFESQLNSWLAMAYLRLGDGVKAAETACRAIDVARELNHKHELAAALRTSGIVRFETAPAGAMPQEAERELKESLALFGELAMRIEEGRSCFALASFYSRTGDLDRCKEFLLRSKEIFQKLGAMGELAVANQLQLR